MIRKVLVPFFAAAVLMVAPKAQAATLTFDLGFVFSGALPDSTAPYLTATFYDGASCTAVTGAACAAGTVELVLKSSLEDPSEFLTEVDFNTNTAITSLGFASTPNLNAGSYALPSLLPYSPDTYKAGGDGLYDLS